MEKVIRGVREGNAGCVHMYVAVSLVTVLPSGGSWALHDIHADSGVIIIKVRHYDFRSSG